MTYRLSRKAEEDVIQLYVAGVREFGHDQAETYFAGLERSFEFLASYPRAGQVRAEIMPPVRTHAYRSHIVVYAIEGRDVLILRVRHAREDWQRAPSGRE